MGPEAGCSPGKIILVQMTLNTFGNVHRLPWTVAVLSQNQDFWHAAFWLILAKKVRIPVVAKAHFVESGPPGARQPWWREHRCGIEIDSFRDRISGWVQPRSLAPLGGRLFKRLGGHLRGHGGGRSHGCSCGGSAVGDGEALGGREAILRMSGQAFGFTPLTGVMDSG